jgi:hypothetical protein
MSYQKSSESQTNEKKPVKNKNRLGFSSFYLYQVPQQGSEKLLYNQPPAKGPFFIPDSIWIMDLLILLDEQISL